MFVKVSDSNVAGELDTTLFSLIQTGPVLASVTIKNTGSNITNYRLQEYNGSAWSDMDLVGTKLNNVLALNQVVAQVVTSAYSQVRLVANASGGSLVDFDVTRRAVRSSGGPLPVLSF